MTEIIKLSDYYVKKGDVANYIDIDMDDDLSLYVRYEVISSSTLVTERDEIDIREPDHTTNLTATIKDKNNELLEGIKVNFYALDNI